MRLYLLQEQESATILIVDPDGFTHITEAGTVGAAKEEVVRTRQAGRLEPVLAWDFVPISNPEYRQLLKEARSVYWSPSYLDLW